MQAEKALVWGKETVAAVEARITPPLQDVCRALANELGHFYAESDLERYSINMPKGPSWKAGDKKKTRLEIDMYSIEELRGYGTLFAGTIKDAMHNLSCITETQNMKNAQAQNEEKVEKLRTQFEIAIGVHCATFEEALKKSGENLTNSEHCYRAMVGSAALLRNELHAINENLRERLNDIMLLR